MTNVTQGFISIGGGSSVSGDSAPPPPPDLGAANFRKDIALGLTQETTLVMNTPPEQTLGLSIEQRATLLTLENLGLSIETFASGTIKPAQNIGLTQGSVLTMQTPPPQNTGFSIEQFWDYTGTKYAATIANTGFSNPNNALGAPNGTLANVAGQALSSTTASLTTTAIDAIGLKDSLNIDLVELRWYTRQTGTVLNNGNLRMVGLRGATQIHTITFSNNQNFLTTPYTYDATGDVTDWDDVRALDMEVRVSLGAGTPLVNVDVDAFEIYIEASLVE